LVKVRLSNPKAALSNLLSGKLAVDWMEQSATALRERMTGRVGPVLQDGGVPVSGIARELSEGEWERVAREFLLTD
ncbi:MAG TPA: hypothetical protein VD788_01785, partial [Candidatus Polarisedimenticolaceae bacterium]|nr:hypothetical protein [Candidatus Polarisedimenticolaceae bacterium]